MNKDKLVIIDGNSLLFRSYFAMRPMVTKDGFHTQGIFAFINMLEKILNDFKPTYIVVAFDVGKKTFRHDIYSEYKAGRMKTPQELIDEIPVLHEILLAMNIKIMEMENYEADDIIGTVTKEASINNIESVVITGDKDELQLIDDNVKVIINKRGMTDFDLYDKAAMKDRYGLTPSQFIDLKGLMGDSSDNLPGVYGVGEKKGIQLLKEYGNLDEVIKNKDLIKGKLGENIRNNIKEALMTRELATINRDVPIEINWNEIKYIEPDYEKLIEIYKRLEFNSFLKKISQNTNNKDEKLNSEFSKIKNIKIDNFLEKLKKDDLIIIYIESNNDHLNCVKVRNLYLYKPEIECISQYKVDSIDGLKKILEALVKLDCKIIGHGLKEQFFSLKSIASDIANNLIISHDTEIAEYILEPNRTRYDLDKMFLSYCGEVIEYEENTKLNKQLTLFDEDENKEADENIIKKRLFAISKVYENQRNEIDDRGLNDIYYNCELPLIKVLSDMELNGIIIEEKTIINIGEELEIKISELSKRITRLAGKEFNISSPKQLGIVLFDEMNLPYPQKSKGKNGYSTAVTILEKIIDEHEIISLILKYRKYTKLKSTYIDGLIKLIASDGRIHPHFQQTVAATGRLSCTEPNLQNIPFRDDYGRLIRKAFVAGSGRTLISADYSQIELRIMAALSGDEDMIEAFNQGKDIHRITASKVFGIPIEDVNLSQRSRAKAVNFGIIYGMSGFGLSEDIHVSRYEADNYIKDYFNKYPKVKEYLDNQVEIGKKDGEVRTIYGRIRQIPEFSSRKFMEREQAKRLAMNTPIQGSAADIIKYAMIAVYNDLVEKGLKSKLILQIHDELIIEAYDDEIDDVKKILKGRMENVAKLPVKLTTDINIGESWYDLK